MICFSPRLIRIRDKLLSAGQTNRFLYLRINGLATKERRPNPLKADVVVGVLG